MNKRLISFLLVIALSAGTFLLTVSAKKIKDSQAPTAPQNLAAASVSQTSVSLKWTASTDNKAVSSY